jgi:hypothetical protein
MFDAHDMNLSTVADAAPRTEKRWLHSSIAWADFVYSSFGSWKRRMAGAASTARTLIVRLSATNIALGFWGISCTENQPMGFQRCSALLRRWNKSSFCYQSKSPASPSIFCFLTSSTFDKNGAIYSALGVHFLGRVKVTPSESHRSHASRHVMFKCVRWPKAIERKHSRSLPVTVSSTHAKRYAERLRLSKIRATCTWTVNDGQLIFRDLYYERPFEKLRVAIGLSVHVVR